jgi:hypothetical protein
MTDRGVVWACIIIAFVAAIVLFLSGRPVTPEPVLFMKPVPIEGITAKRMQDTFARRFAVLPEGGDAIAERVETKPAVASPALPPARIVRRVSLRRDVCARHGMRKVTYGKRWRCRR